MAVLNIALCEGRHETPEAVDGAIFQNVISDITDLEEINRLAFNGLWDASYRRYREGQGGFLRPIDGEAGEKFILELCPSLHVNLYVTGLTVALIAALNVCRERGIRVTLYHYDKNTGKYFPQEVE